MSRDPIAVRACEIMAEGSGCTEPGRPQGSCSTCRGLAKIAREASRPVLEPATMGEAGHVLASAAGAECYVCRRTPHPDLTFKNLAVCAPCASVAPNREWMDKMNDTNQAEDNAGMAAIDRAGEYLGSIGKFDLRDLTDEELRQFNAHFICGFSESMREQASKTAPF